jgi:hypothetical protein
MDRKASNGHRQMTRAGSLGGQLRSAATARGLGLLRATHPLQARTPAAVAAQPAQHTAPTARATCGCFSSCWRPSTSSSGCSVGCACAWAWQRAKWRAARTSRAPDCIGGRRVNLFGLSGAVLWLCCGASQLHTCITCCCLLTLLLHRRLAAITPTQTCPRQRWAARCCWMRQRLLQSRRACGAWVLWALQGWTTMRLSPARQHSAAGGAATAATVTSARAASRAACPLPASSGVRWPGLAWTLPCCYAAASVAHLCIPPCLPC